MVIMANLIEELFTIRDAHPSNPRVHLLVNDLGETLGGTFYEPVMHKVSVPKDKLHRVESVLQRQKVGKRREALVKWYGFPHCSTAGSKLRLSSYINTSQAPVDSSFEQ